MFTVAPWLDAKGFQKRASSISTHRAGNDQIHPLSSEGISTEHHNEECGGGGSDAGAIFDGAQKFSQQHTSKTSSLLVRWRIILVFEQGGSRDAYRHPQKHNLHVSRHENTHTHTHTHTHTQHTKLKSHKLICIVLYAKHFNFCNKYHQIGGEEGFDHNLKNNK